MIERFLKRMVALMGIGASLSGCDGTNISFGDRDGMPLAELDLSSPAPTELALGSGDTVILRQGDTLAITVEGDDAARDDLRFVRDGAMLGIGRASGLGTNKASPATIRVTMAAPTELMISGSGAIEAQSLASTAELAIGGSGSISFASVDAERLEIAIGRSGKVTGAGTAKRMEINIGGRGDIDLTKLNAERAEITIGGSGDIAFASNGTVEATIAGSGKLTCTPGDS